MFISPSRDPLWYFIGLGVAALCVKAGLGLDTTAAAELIKVLMITAGTLFGFLLTSLSILLAISDRDLMKGLRSSGKVNNLLSQLFLSALVLVVAIATGIAWLLTHEPYIPAIMCGIVAFSLVVFLRIGWKYKNLFSLLD